MLPQAWTAATGLEMTLEVGVDAIRARNQELTERVVSRCDEAGLEILTPREPASRGGLIRVRIPGGRSRTEDILHRLFERQVVLDSRQDTFRISPHFFNDEDDVDRCFTELRSLL